MQDVQSVAFVPRFRMFTAPLLPIHRISHLVPFADIVEKNITHIGQTNSDLMSNNTIHAQNLRVIGKVISGTPEFLLFVVQFSHFLLSISAIEATRLYTFSDKNSAVESLIRRHISRFDVADEDKHMNAFYERRCVHFPSPSLRILKRSL